MQEDLIDAPLRTGVIRDNPMAIVTTNGAYVSSGFKPVREYANGGIHRTSHAKLTRAKWMRRVNHGGGW